MGGGDGRGANVGADAVVGATVSITTDALLCDNLAVEETVEGCGRGGKGVSGTAGVSE